MATDFLSKYINVPFPTEIEDSAISENWIDPNGRPTKYTSHRIWSFRKIEAEIVSVLFQNEEIPASSPSLDAWMSKMEAAIYEWDAEVHQSAASNTDPSTNSKWAEMELYANIAKDYIIITLFRPCPRIKDPSCQNLMKVFVAAVRVADGYWQQSNLDFGKSLHER